MAARLPRAHFSRAQGALLRAQFEELDMYLYENVIRNHELMVAKSLERYDRRTGKDAERVHVYPLFARARRTVRRK